MTQKNILNFFSPSNLPPKRREREGEPLVVNRGKKRKPAAVQRTGNKRSTNNAGDSVPKKIKLNDTRAKTEAAVEKRNDMFNTKNELMNPPEAKLNGISLESINVNSLTDIGRSNRMKALLKQWDNDITVMVDTRIPESRAKFFNSYDKAVISTNKPFRGIMIQINKKLDPELMEADEEDANYLAITFDLDGKKIGLIAIYAPNNDDPRFFRNAINKLLTKMTLKTDEMIIAGDFNVNMSQGIGYSSNKSYKKEALEECMKVWGLKDTIEYNAKRCGVEPITYIHTTKNKGHDGDIFPLKAARLDAILTTIDPATIGVAIGRFYPSDHASVRITLREAKESGKKVWKLNAKLLEEEILIKRWKHIANNLTDANDSLKIKLLNERNISERRYIDVLGKDAFKRWGDLVGIIKSQAIEFTREKEKASKERNSSFLSREEINNLDKEELDDILEEINRQELDKTKIKTELKNYKLNSSNKKLTKHKYRMEEQSRKIKKIIINGKPLTNSDKIKEGVQRYYKYQFRCGCKNVVKPKPCIMCKTSPVQYAKIAANKFKKRSYKQNKLTAKLKDNLEKKISMHEMDDFVLKKLKIKLKSPGPDGLPYEFYSVFWKEIRILVSRIIDWIFTVNEMPDSLPEGLIVFLPKKGKDKTIIKNLRPLTLLNTLYKIASGHSCRKIKIGTAVDNFE